MQKIKKDRPLYVTEFQLIAKKDPFVRNGLIALGVILPRELEDYLDHGIFDEDLCEEIEMQTDETHDPEYMIRKAGVETEDTGLRAGGV